MILMSSNRVLFPPALTFHFALSSLPAGPGIPSRLSLLALEMQIIPEHLQNAPGVKPAAASPFGSSQACPRCPEDNIASRKCLVFFSGSGAPLLQGHLAKCLAAVSRAAEGVPEEMQSNPVPQ